MPETVLGVKEGADAKLVKVCARLKFTSDGGQAAYKLANR